MARFPQAEGTIFLRAIRALRNRVVGLPTSYHSCHSCRRKVRSILARKARIARFPQAEDTIYLALRAPKNRAIDLSISYHSCYSCSKKSCHRLVDIVSFVPFVQTESRHSCQQNHEESLQKVKSQDNRNFPKRARKGGKMGVKRELMGRRSQPSYRNVTFLQVGCRLPSSWMATPSQLNEGFIPIGRSVIFRWHKGL
jgi:hypothetical protein